MYKQFEIERFDIVKTDRVQIPNYKFGHNNGGTLDVWIDSGNKGKRFLRQVTVLGNTYPMLTGVYTKECYILCEKLTRNYYFLDINECGIWLFNHTFSGSENFSIDESIKIHRWLEKTP